MSQVEIVDLPDAKTFFDYLSPLNRRVEKGTLLYRGQGNADWGLEPSIFRHMREYFSGHPDLENFHTYGRESMLLMDFCNGCDKSATPIPNDSPTLRQLLSPGRVLKSSGEKWPFSDTYQVMAVAQHYGVPTRLLDWTEHPYIAIFFAASQAKYESGERIAVYVLNYMEALFRDIEIIKIPSTYNRNIAAQHGCFTVIPQEIELHCPLKLDGCMEAFHTMTTGNNFLTKVTVPRNCIYSVLQLCTEFCIDHASLFPGYGGAAQYALNRISPRDPFNNSST